MSNSEGNDGDKLPGEIDWNLPLLSGPNLRIVFEQCQLLQDAKRKGTKKNKFVPNLSYARESRTELNEPKPGPSKHVEVVEKHVSTDKPKKSSKKINLVQSEGLNVFSNCISDNDALKQSFENFSFKDTRVLSKINHNTTFCSVEDRKLLSFQSIYKDLEVCDNKVIPLNDLPFGLSCNEVLNKSVQQTIRDMETPEDYNRMYVNASKVSRALQLPFDSNSAETSMSDTVIFLVQFPGVFPALLKRIPAFDGEEELTVVDDIGRNVSGYPCTLDDLPEGKVATLQILKSGRMKLKFGECDFWLTKGAETGIQEEAVLIDVNGNEKNGNMYKLGNIDSHIIATPDFLIDGNFGNLLDDYNP